MALRISLRAAVRSGSAQRLEGVQCENGSLKSPGAIICDENSPLPYSPPVHDKGESYYKLVRLFTLLCSF